LAVQPQSEAASSRERTEELFPVLADSEHEVADAYGVYNLFSDGEAGASVFIINQDLEILWEHLPESITDRAQSLTILENLPD
jgi:alkyl hydroperoxide reductase subunit AhpC